MWCYATRDYDIRPVKCQHTMTGMLVDRGSVLLGCAALAWGLGGSMEVPWHAAPVLLQTWSLLVLGAFLPAALALDTRGWRWPLDKRTCAAA